MKTGQWIENSTARLRSAGLDSPRVDVEILLADILSVGRVDLHLRWDKELSNEEQLRAEALLRRREHGEPVAYLLGKKDFYSLEFAISSGVLIPRPETEGLVELGLKELLQKQMGMVVDLGCGSGCIGLSILANNPNAELVGFDASETAIECSRKNADKLKLTTRAKFINLDLNLEQSPKKTADFLYNRKANLVVSNPPYIAEGDVEVDKMVEKYEPQEALFADDNGLGAIKRWSKIAAEILSPGGLFLMEIGYKQGQNVFEFFSGLGEFKDIKVIKDLSGKDRILSARKN